MNNMIMEQLILDKMNAICNGISKQTNAFYSLGYTITSFRLGEQLQLPRSNYNGDTSARFQKKSLDNQLKSQHLVEIYNHINAELCQLYREGVVTLDYAKKFALASSRSLMDTSLTFHTLANDAAVARTQCENFLSYENI